MTSLRLLCCLLAAGALPSQTVEGTVTSTTGTLLLGAEVALLQAGDRKEATEYHTTTDTTGSFRLQNVKEGLYVVQVQLEGYLPPNPGGPGNRPFPVTAGSPSKHIDLQMMPEGKVSGWVVDTEGSPVPGSKLVLAIPYGVRQETTAAADGSFAFDSVSPGMYSLLAVPPLASKPPDPVDGQDFAWLPTYLGGDSARIVVHSGSDLAAQKLKLLAGPVRRLRGVLLDPSGHSAPGVEIHAWLKEPAGKLHSTVSQADGSFAFSVTEGDWQLSASGLQQAASLSVLVARKDLDVTLQLSMSFSIHGVVRFDPPERSKMPTGILFVPENNTHMPVLGVVSADGIFTAAGLYPGVYTITMAPALPAPGYFLDSIHLGNREVLSRQVEILSGEIPVSIRFHAGGGAIRGTVKDCGSATILLLPQDPAMRRQGLVRSARCAEGDRFEIPSIRPGAYYVLALESGSAPLVPPHNLDQDYVNQSLRLNIENRGVEKIELQVTPQRRF